jgi:acetylornithine deacetylase/succinyl-diaminopimelate desuccinylase-like protein
VNRSADDVVSCIDQDELVRLALEVCNIDSAGINEAAVAQFVGTWLYNEGFSVRNVGLLPDRYNVLARRRGSGGGYSLIFNSHMDTSVRATDVWSHVDPTADVYHKAWREGDDLFGEGIVNDKGPMAAFMIAAKAIAAAGRELKGDLLLSAVVAETSHEAADEPPGTIVETKDLGARFLVTHGGVADYALIAEGTGFSIVDVEAGMAWYKLIWRSDQPAYYTPYLPERTVMRESPNMIVRAAVAVAALEDWSRSYQQRYTRRSGDALIVPKAQIGAIRGGNPTGIASTPQICALYVGCFIPPAQDPLDLRLELEQAVRNAGVPASEVELYLFRPGYQAKNAERLVEAVRRAHRRTFNNEPAPPDSPTCSMWRDINIWNEMGIPAITYGPRSVRHSHTRSLSVDALYQAACVYARTIVDICNQEKPRTS